MAWTFVCPTEIVAFSNATTQFSSRGAQVVICSTDSEYSLLAWRNTAQQDGGLGPVDIPLLSDKNHQISRDYGVLIEEEGIALRGMFLIDPLGILRQVRLDSYIAVKFEERYVQAAHSKYYPIENIGGHRVDGCSARLPQSSKAKVTNSHRLLLTTFLLAAASKNLFDLSMPFNSSKSMEKSALQTGRKDRRE